MLFCFHFALSVSLERSPIFKARTSFNMVFVSQTAWMVNTIASYCTKTARFTFQCGKQSSMMRSEQSLPKKKSAFSMMNSNCSGRRKLVCNTFNTEAVYNCIRCKENVNEGSQPVVILSRVNERGIPNLHIYHFYCYTEEMKHEPHLPLLQG